MTDTNNSVSQSVHKELIPLTTVGTTVQIEVQGVDFRFGATLVGLIPKQCIILQTPRSAQFNAVRNFLSKGRKIVLRYLINGTVFGIETLLLGIINDPLSLMFISYPEVVDRHDLRVKKRVSCYLPLGATICEEFYRGYTTDLSEDGCRISIKGNKDNYLPDVKAGDMLSFRFRLPGSEKKFQATGEVKNCNKDAFLLYLGVVFTDFTDEMKTISQSYISFMDEVQEEQSL